MAKNHLLDVVPILSVYPVNNQNRISATGTLINRLKHVDFLVTESSKAEAGRKDNRTKTGFGKTSCGFGSTRGQLSHLDA